jgi:hypothetical protein
VRRGLLTPETSGKGGRNPYQVFTAEHVRAAKFICPAAPVVNSIVLADDRESRDAGIRSGATTDIRRERLSEPANSPAFHIAHHATLPKPALR